MSTTLREARNSYATDGRCHNAEPGTYGHECGKPAVWLGAKAGRVARGEPFVMGFCDACKEHGTEANAMARWERIPPKPDATAKAADAWADFDAECRRQGGNHG